MPVTTCQKDVLKFTGFISTSRSMEPVARLSSFTSSHWSDFIAAVLVHILFQDNCKEWRGLNGSIWVTFILYRKSGKKKECSYW